MKRIICLITVLCLVFGSFSFCFAIDWSSSDSQNLSNAASRLYYMNQSAAYYLYNIANNTNNIYNKLIDIYSALFSGSHSVAYWAESINSWMSPILSNIQAIYQNAVSESVSYLLGYPSSQNGQTIYSSYQKMLAQALSNFTFLTGETFSSAVYSHAALTGSSNTYTVPVVNTSTGQPFDYSVFWTSGTPVGNLAVLLRYLNYNVANIFSIWDGKSFTGYNSTQNVVNWGNLSTSTFTPTSSIDGIYKYLSSIQAPVSRLSYVLASQERIDAQEAAAANEEVVVDNFIDSTGDGSASPSDFGSISDLSSGYKSNFGSDASVSGIFNIFNSNNMGWFSQETANQLDTTTPTRRGSSFDTPLLDQQIEDIYDQIGVKHD